MILNFRQLEVFRAIMIAKTINGAADLLNVSQPGISRLLKYMEYKLGIALFERHKGRLIPTPEGEELFQELEPIYAKIEGLDVVIKRITQTDDLQLRIACTSSLANYIIPRLMAEIKKEMPGTEVHLETLPNEAIAEYIVQRRCDFALGFNCLEHPLVLSEPSIKMEMICVVPKGHPLTSIKNVSFEDIAQYELIMFYPDTQLGKHLNGAFEELGLSPKVTALIRYVDNARAMVEQGLGISFAFKHGARSDNFPNVESIPISGNDQRLHFFRHNGIAMSDKVQKFYNKAKSVVRTFD